MDKIQEVEKLIKEKASNKDFNKYYNKLEEVYNGLTAVKEYQSEYERKIKEAESEFKQRIKEAKSKKKASKKEEES